MEKFRDIMKGEHPIDYGAEKCKWKIDKIPKNETAPKAKIIISNLSEFRLRGEDENVYEYGAAKSKWKLNNQ